MFLKDENFQNIQILHFGSILFFFYQIDPNAFHAKINIMEDVAQPAQLPEF